MAVPDRFDSGSASDVLATHSVDYEELYKRVQGAASAVIVANSAGDPCQRDLGEILLAMLETHESMRSVYLMAARVEKKEQRKTGRWMDTLLLARPQYDALFIALLLAHDYAKWRHEYEKACWAGWAIQACYLFRRYRRTSEGRELMRDNLRRLKEYGDKLGVSPAERYATTAEVLGRDLTNAPRFGATGKNRIEPLPTPGKIIAEKLLTGGSYERLASLLWQQWRPRCDPVHIGMSLLVQKGSLRADDGLSEGLRRDQIDEWVTSEAIYPSFAAIMTLVTMLTIRHPSKVELRARVVEAWKDLDSGTHEGSIIWQGWARQALGILSV